MDKVYKLRNSDISIEFIIIALTIKRIKNKFLKVVTKKEK